ncbi:carboxylesterase/lipase family protein [Actinomycetospora sp. TBRC 11914]|uniref:carboxylesterase/lipase family protein n=1 Tax=Actinomycetospora sp. TBRC 11914 TaxID=2729387 RepID=UPI00145DC5F6|nr:carboxylesterase family protein [Actinomycetospora sp. TBRC 11914]NMO94020.1 carboxylesterase/lipase family protein [Actinomycetospora sp. TBRC 11914]
MEARTTAGRVRGVEKDGVHRFLGVPYAAPPVRFTAPEPPPRWDGVRDADRPGPNAPQPTRGIPGVDLSPILGHGWRPGDDYLTVDVWTPGGPGLPVMVFLHGGAFLAGEPGAPAYDGTALARAGVVLVSVTYRLGVEGFLPLPGGATNVGLRDQLAALRWVRENAAAFGGDPGVVTVFGESAGAMSVGALLGSPLATGLFDRAIVQSGGAEVVRSLEVMQAFAPRFTAELGVETDAAAVRDRPVADAITALDAAQAPERRGDLREPDGVDPGFGVGVLAPVVGDDVLPVAPLGAIRAGAGAEVDLLAGANDEEMNLYLVPSGAVDAMTEDQARAALAAVHPEADRLLGQATGSPGARYASVVTDLLFRGPARRIVAAHRGRGHRYEFGWRSTAFGGRLGACHGLELPFVFGTLTSASGPDALAGEDPPWALADEMVAVWTAFARTGDPGWGPDDGPRRFG